MMGICYPPLLLWLFVSFVVFCFFHREKSNQTAARHQHHRHPQYDLGIIARLGQIKRRNGRRWRRYYCRRRCRRCCRRCCRCCRRCCCRRRCRLRCRSRLRRRSRFRLPLGGVDRIGCHRCGHYRRPAGKGIAAAGRCSAGKCRGGSSTAQVAGYLIRKAGSADTVCVGNRILLDRSIQNKAPGLRRSPPPFLPYNQYL